MDEDTRQLFREVIRELVDALYLPGVHSRSSVQEAVDFLEKRVNEAGTQ